MAKDPRKCGQPIGEVCWYDIGGQQFYQQTLAMGQSMRLAPILHGVSFGDMQSKEVLAVLGDRIGEVLEIVLIPKAKPVEQHVEELYTPGAIERKVFFLAHLTHMDLMYMVEDFFGCNLDSSLTMLMQQGPQALISRMNQGAPTTTNGSAPSSPEETPPIAERSLV